MNAIQLLEKLDLENIKITVDAGDLDIKAPKGSLTVELKQYLKEHKTVVIDLLSGTECDQQPIKPIERTSPLTLSFAQQRLWFLNQFEGGSDTQYNIPWALRLKGSLDIAALQKAFNSVVQRHESLRTSFQSVDDEAVQIIADNLELDIPVIDIIDGWIPRYIHEHNDHLFDLSSGPLIKVSLLRILPNEHILLINMHHIASDGWSIGVLNQELSELYTAYSQGKKPPLSPLPIQYADFAYWQRQWLQGEVLEQQVDYWKTQLSGTPALLELPTDRPRPAKQSYRGSHHTFTLSAELTQGLQRLSRKEGSTLFMTLFAGFNVLLTRYSGQNDICVGTPIANRQRQEMEGLIGFFINTLILRTQLQINATFKELLHQVKATALSAYAHQDIPFEHLVEALNPERSMSYSPLYQVMFVLQNAAETSLSLPNIRVSPIDSNTRTAKFDLTMALEESDNGIKGILEYSTDLFDQSTIERLCQHYQILLEGIVTNPNQAIASLPLLSKSEQQLITEWNNTGTVYPAKYCIQQLFEQQAETNPNAIALVYEDRQLSYQDLNHKSNQLAHYLIEQGVGPEVRVGLCVERSLDMVIGILAILKAGGAYVPIDPNNPADRIEHIVKDSTISVLLTQADLLDSTLEEQAATCVCLDRDRLDIKQFSSDNPPVRSLSENLAYVIYTSGSTGLPKGTLITHANVARLFANTQAEYQFNQDDIWTLFHSFAFDFSVWELWGGLCYGGKVIVVPYWISREPERFCQLVYEQGVTVLNQTPSAFNQFIAADKALGLDPTTLALRYVIFGGEALELKNLEPWFERHGDQQPQLVNMYGITETTVHVTYRPLKQTDVQNSSSVIGHKLSDLQTYILDQQLQPTPIGVPGELYVGGGGVARGYLNKPDLSAQRFIPNAFSKEPGARLYKTGDLARYLPDGDMQYQGRIDQQVKIRGFRIELGEIENALAKQPGVKEAVLLAHRRGPESGNQYLAAYVVAEHSEEQEENLDQDRLRDGLRQSLPDYMLPSFFVFMAKLPLTSNGKLDRKALPEPDVTALQTPEYIAPSSDIEKQMVEIWAEVLCLPQDAVGVLHDFFELGGNSISLIRIISLCKKSSLEVAVKEVFEQRTIRQLSMSLANAEQAEHPSFSLEMEIDLDKSISGSELAPAQTDQPKAIFLTGSTGFVGAFLLKELLTQTDAQIYCLIRADSDQQALSRIIGKLRSYDLYDKTELQRIVVVLGDLSKPLFGLTLGNFDSLSAAIDLIIHNGAWVNHLYPYDTLKATNVGGTREILRLATREKLKAVHHISVFNADFIAEKDFSALASGPHVGYGLTKYAAEKMILSAAERAIPISIHRLDMISGDHRGVSNTNDRIYLLVKGCIALNCAPDAEGLANICAPRLTPVDFVAKAIVSLSKQQECVGNIYNISNPAPMQWNELLVAITEMGYDIETVPLAQWKAKLAEAAKLYPDEKMYGTLSGLYLGEIPKIPLTGFSSEFSQEDSYQTMLNALDKEGVNCAQVGRERLKMYLNYLDDSGFLQPFNRPFYN